MTFASRLTLAMVTLVALTAIVIGSLSYNSVEAPAKALELSATLSIILVAVILARAVSEPPAVIAEVIRQLVDDPDAAEPVTAAGRAAERTSQRTTTLLHRAAATLARRPVGAETKNVALELDRMCISIVKSASYPIIGKKMDGTIIAWNSAAEQLYQYTAEEAVGNNITMIVPPDRLKEHLAVVAQVLSEGHVDNVETVRVAKNGRRIDVSLCLSSDEYSPGMSMDADITRDISDEKFTAKKFQLAFNACLSGMVMVEGNGQIAMVNTAAERMFNYKREQLIGKPIQMLIPAALDDAGAKQVDFSTLSEISELRPNPDLVGRRQDGTEFPVEVNLKSIRHDQNYIGLCVIVDITERKRLDRLKDEFVSTVSHELRTPMTSIFASLALLTNGAAGKMPDSATRLLAISYSNCKRLVRLVDDILDVQKLESGQSVFKLERLNVRPLVEKTIESLRSFARDHGISVRLDVASNDCQVSVDPDRLIQVVTNLLSNAIKFSRTDTEVVVSIERRNETVVILVRDRGPGIPEDFKSRIFQKFAQADGKDSREKSGTGLGLSIVRQIVERLGGQVGFRDAEGGGTVFYVVLPCAAPKGSTQAEVAGLLHDARSTLRLAESA